jgi:hypothetical protein
MKRSFSPVLFGFAFGLAGAVGALDIQFDYSYDTQGFFAEPLRKQVLEAAAKSWESKLEGVPLPAIPLGTGINTWSLKFNRPDTAADLGAQNTSLVNKPLPENTVIIYVGGRPDVYGGFAGYAEFGYTMFGTLAWVEQISSRNTGTRFCSFGGAIAFDSDAGWYFDSDPSTTEAFPQLLDFYTIAMHEIGHLMGFNNGSAAFNRLRLGGGFKGERTVKVFGGEPKIEPDGHWPGDFLFQGRGLVMRPLTTVGERVELSPLDVSVLQDLGYVAPTGVKVVLGPAAAVSAGARWTLNGGPERASGVVVSGLSEGQYTIAFKAVAGYFTPESRVVQVEAGIRTVVNCDYVPVPVPKVLQVSESSLVNVGANVKLEVGAEGGGVALSYLWKRAGKVLTGVQTASYALNSVQTSQAGVYSVEVKSVGGGAAATNMNVGVVGGVVGPDIVNEDGAFTLTQTAVGPGLQYQWCLGKELLSDDLALGISGVRSATLRVRKSAALFDGMYQCRVRMPDAAGGGERELFGPDKRVSVRLRPVVETRSLGPWKVSGSVSEVLAARNGPTQFRVTGLPSGVVLSRGDGHLSGRPLSPGTFRLGISAGNLAGWSPIQFIDVVCDDLVARGKGIFAGLVDREASNGGLGGVLSFSVSSSGGLSGSVSMGSEVRSFRGVWESLPGPDLTSSISIARGKGVMPWVLELDLDAETGEVTGKVCEDGQELAGVGAWQSDWNAKTSPAEAFKGVYAVGLEPPAASNAADSEVLIPEGVGYATLNVSVAGIVNWAGKLAEGSTVTRSLRLGREGQIPLHSLFYSGTGSLQGWATIRPDLAALSKTEVDGDLSWVKNAQLNSRSTVYREGFPLHTLSVTGGAYVASRPVVEQLGLEEVLPNARLSFEGGWGGGVLENGVLEDGVLENGYFEVLLGISSANRIQPPDTDENPDLVRMTSLSAQSGLFRGEFSQRGSGRKVLWYGMLVPQRKLGMGWFLRTVTASDGSVSVRSGRVDLQVK